MRHIKYLVIFFVVAWFLLNLFSREIVPVNGGYGWDGEKYGLLASNFSEISTIPYYYDNRVFPSFVIYLINELFVNAEPMSAKLLDMFYLYNCMVIFLGMYLFYQIKKILTWTDSAFVIGFLGMFLNYPVLKLIPYYSTLTDPTALTIGIALVYSYLRRSILGVFIATMLGTYTYPLIIYSSIFLFIFPRNKDNSTDIIVKIPEQLTHRYIYIVFSVLFSLVMFSLYVFIVYFTSTSVQPEQMFTVLITAKKHPWYIHVLSAMFLCFYVFYISYAIRDLTIRVNFSHIGILVFVSLLMIRMLIYNLFFNKAAVADGPLSPIRFVYFLIIESLSFPLGFLLNHFIYYGPVVCLFILFWKKILMEANRTGFGLLLSLLFYVSLSVGTESRQFINALPLFIVILCCVLNEMEIKIWSVIYFVFVSMFVSKFWLKINVEPWAMTQNSVSYLEFPQQMYFMSQGPWMSDFSYAIQLLISLLLVVSFVVINRLVSQKQG